MYLLEERNESHRLGYLQSGKPQKENLEHAAHTKELSDTYGTGMTQNTNVSLYQTSEIELG
jgi:hypothetical protein